ncbi:fatty acyl-CoA synthetase [Yimella sp. cx-51]
MMDVTTLRSNTVSDVIRRSAARFGDAVAVRFQDRDWTYRELDDAVTRVAVHLRETLGVAPATRVAALGKNSDAYLISFLACARAGLIHVPLNYNLLGRELDHLVHNSGSKLVLVDPSFADRLDSIEHRPDLVVPLRDADDSILTVAQGDSLPDFEEQGRDTDTVQLLYTSGTTSAPKGAIMSHRALVSEYMSCLEALDLQRDDNPLHVMPLYHSAQMHVFILPGLMVGATNTILETPDAGDILHRLANDGHRSFFAAPTLWVGMANHPTFEELSFDGLAKAYYGASIMPVPVLRKWQAKAPSIGFYNCFGQSEIAPLAAVLRPEEHDERPDSAGRPVLFVEARVVDAAGNDVPVGEAGEIIYRSPQLCDGYWENFKATEEAFAGGWFHSGDLVRQDEQGYLFVVDRIKDVINTGGVLVASREVEDALYTHSGVAEVAVVGVPDEKWVEKIVAFVVRRPEASELSADDLIAHTREQVAAFKVPKQIEFIDDLPRNASGKILKRELRG